MAGLTSLASLVLITTLNLGNNKVVTNLSSLTVSEIQGMGYTALVEERYEDASKFYAAASLKSTLAFSDPLDAQILEENFGVSNLYAVGLKRISDIVRRLKPGGLELRTETLLVRAQRSKSEGKNILAKDLYELAGWAFYFYNGNTTMGGGTENTELPKAIIPSPNDVLYEWATRPGNFIGKAMNLENDPQEKEKLKLLQRMLYLAFSADR